MSEQENSDIYITPLEEVLASPNKDEEIKKMETLLDESHAISKKQLNGGCAPEEYAQHEKMIKAIESAKKILNHFK